MDNLNNYNPSIDEILKELNKICKKQYLLKIHETDVWYMKIIKLIRIKIAKEKSKYAYADIFESIRILKLKSMNCKRDVIYSIQDVISLRSAFENLESSSWNNTFIFLGLWLTIISGIVINIFNLNNESNLLIAWSSVSLILIEAILYIYFYYKNFKSNRIKCFYELVLKIFSEEQ